MPISRIETTLLLSANLSSSSFHKVAEFDGFFPESGSGDLSSSLYFLVLNNRDVQQQYLLSYDFSKDMVVSNVTVGHDADHYLFSGLVYRPTSKQVVGVIVENYGAKQRTTFVRIDPGNGTVTKLQSFPSPSYWFFSGTADLVHDIYYCAVNGSLVSFNMSSGALLRSVPLDTRITTLPRQQLYLHYSPPAATLVGVATFAEANESTAVFELDPGTGRVTMLRAQVDQYDCSFHAYGFDDTEQLAVFGLGSSVVPPQTCLDGDTTYFVVDMATGKIVLQAVLPFYSAALTPVQEFVFVAQ